MSLAKTYTIRCPQCEHTQDVDLYDSIHVAQQPELKAALLENRLNRVGCESCDTNFRVDKPLLYHDADRNILIHWMPETGLSRDEILDEFDDAIAELRAAFPEGEPPPRVRLVFTRIELVELIFIIEAGMEERVVEHIKYSLYTRNLDKLPPAEKQLLLNVKDSTADELLFAVRNVETGGLEQVLRYPHESYRGVQQMYRDNPDEFMEFFPGPFISARDVLMNDVEEVQ